MKGVLVITENFSQIMKISLKLVNVEKKFFEKLSDNKFNSFQQKSINTLSQDYVEGQRFLSCTGNQKDIIISLMTMKTTINTRKNQKISRKVQEESVEAI